MLDIYLCDDNKEELAKFAEYIRKILLIEDLDMHLTLATTDYRELLEKISRTDDTGLFLLDVDLNSDISGFELAQRLRQIQPRCYIIFLTAHQELMGATFLYKVEALDYIEKGLGDKIHTRLHECLNDINGKQLAKPKSLVVTAMGKQRALAFDEIIVVQTTNFSHKLQLVTPHRVLEFPGDLNDIASQLDSRFYRCHRSCIINKDYIDEVDFQTNTVRMKNNMVAPIAMRTRRGLKKFMAQKD